MNKEFQVSEGGRINYLDAIKCLGILLVIEGHVGVFGMGIETYDSLSALMLYSFNMPLFFFVSGFLAYKTQQLAAPRIIKKIWQKFYYLVIPAIVFYFFRQVLEHSNPLDIFSIGLGGYWFTITLFECFLLQFIIILFVKNDKMQIIVLVSIAILGIGFLSITDNFGHKLVDLNRLSKYFHFFVMGILAMKYRMVFEHFMRSEISKAIGITLFFLLLFMVNYDLWPGAVFHILRDIVLRYLGTFIVVSWFVNHDSLFNTDTKIIRLILDIGKKSLAIYLLQYFFIPDFKAYTIWLAGMDEVTVHVISLTYTFVIVATCYVFISLLSNSMIIRKYFLGLKI